MKLPIGNGHHAGKKEGDGACEETERDQDAAKEFKHAADSCLRNQTNLFAARHAAEPAEQNQTASLNEQKSRHDAKEKVSYFDGAFHVGEYLQDLFGKPIDGDAKTFCPC